MIGASVSIVSANAVTALTAVSKLCVMALATFSQSTFAVKSCTAAVALCSIGVTESRIGSPNAAFSCLHDSFRLPRTFSQPSASREACPSAPDSFFESSTIFRRVSCFWISESSLYFCPKSSIAAAFRVVSVAESPRAASLAKLPFKKDCNVSVACSTLVS